MNDLVKKYGENENFRLVLQIILILLLSRLFMLMMMAVYNIYMGTDHSISFLMNQWDAKRYQFMIDNGYTFPLDTDPQANWAFFPLYVIVCQAVKLATFGLVDTYWIGMIVSNVCITAAAFYAVRYIRNLNRSAGRFLGDSGLLIAVLMLAGPYTFYCSSAYTEAMFILFIVLFFWFCQQKRYVLAGLMAAFASATRIVGCLLVFSLIIELYMQMAPGRISLKGIRSFAGQLITAPKKIFAILLCPLGAFLYMAFLRFFCGDVWAFKNVQIAWREDEFFPIIGVLFKACTGQIEPRYTYMGWFCIGVLAVYGYMIYRRYYSMAVFGIVSLLVALTSHVMSTCRFTIGAFVIFAGVYDLLKRCEGRRKWLKWAVLVFFGLAEAWLLIMWYNSDCWLM